LSGVLRTGRLRSGDQVSGPLGPDAIVALRELGDLLESHTTGSGEENTHLATDPGAAP
jgi:hypothetical protein